MKNLPDVTAFNTDKEYHNFQERYYSENENNLVRSSGNINKEINEIFASKNHVYQSKVELTLKDNSKYEDSIIGRTSTQLIFKSGKKIDIIDILAIKKIK